MGIESPHFVPVKWCRHKQGQSPAVLVEFGIWNAVHIARRTTEVKVPCANNKSACKRCQQIFLATFKNLCIIHRIDSLVTCRSSQKRTPEPLWERASSKLRCPVCAGSYAATKPKARFHKGFLLSAATLSQVSIRIKVTDWVGSK